VSTLPRRIPFTDDDLSDLARRGVTVEEALAQLDRITRGSGDVALERPALAGDGVQRFIPSECDAMRARADRVRRAGRITSFVPASGAASRMFASLIRWRERPGPLPARELWDAEAEGDRAARETAEFFRRVREFAFAPALEQALAARGEAMDVLAAAGPHRPVLDAVLDDPGLGYARRPKGLVAFHAEGSGFRTALDEHLADAARLMADGRARVRLHVTVSPEHDEVVGRWLERAAGTWGERLGVHYEVGRSVQHPATDTLAAASNGAPARGADGRLVFRPAGHGSLLANLSDCRADIAFLKNVDNVATEPWKGPTDAWIPVLIGALVDLEERRARAWEGLDSGAEGIPLAEAFLRDHMRETLPGGADPEARVAALRARLDRPIRVCGMVPISGEPGGGPFWVRDRDGGSALQIVEDAQVSRDPGQRSILSRSTHFNPVFMAVSLRDVRGRNYDLARFSDPEAVIVTRKPSPTGELLALERPGLWNGGMAGWLSLFVEVPGGVFTPVKTVLDLLRHEHRPA
jgi:hypothetical protein